MYVIEFRINDHEKTFLCKCCTYGLARWRSLDQSEGYLNGFKFSLYVTSDISEAEEELYRLKRIYGNVLRLYELSDDEIAQAVVSRLSV